MRGSEQDFPETRGLSASAPLFTFRSANFEIRIIMLTAFSRGRTEQRKDNYAILLWERRIVYFSEPGRILEILIEGDIENKVRLVCIQAFNAD